MRPLFAPLTCLALMACASERSPSTKTSGSAHRSEAPPPEERASQPDDSQAIADVKPLAGPAESSLAAREESAPELPPHVKVGITQEISLSGDRPVRVVHARAGLRQAVVYLHGMCGNPKGPDPWVKKLAEVGTLVIVRANVPCKGRPGYRWPKTPEEIQPRIDAALNAVRADRGGQLDLATPLLIGYSQGAHRGERLVAAHPERYKRVVLGGPPTSPEPANLRTVSRVAVLGGELENHDHMLQGARDLEAAQVDTRFFLLPKAHHGDYGPEGPEVMDQVIRWVTAD